MLESLEEKAQHRTVAIFPEGTRSLDGKLNSFYRGFIHLLRATGNDILPVTLNGFYKLKPKNRFRINFGSRLGVVIHPPIESEKLVPSSDREIMDWISKVLESANSDKTYDK
jgi:1-acyl-sn-glycerol-3-phosphate acyltransferase